MRIGCLFIVWRPRHRGRRKRRWWAAGGQPTSCQPGVQTIRPSMWLKWESKLQTAAPC
jgi:hypothetical protein